MDEQQLQQLKKQIANVHTRVGAALLTASAVYVRDVGVSFATSSPTFGAFLQGSAALSALGGILLLWLTEPKS